MVDLYCMYNRARGTDLISPEDLLIACEKLNQMTESKIIMRTFAKSGVKVIQAKHFNQEGYFKKLEEEAKKIPGITADFMAQEMRVNVVLMKELLKVISEFPKI